MEIPKALKNIEDEDELIDWLIFLQNPNAERVKKKMKENEELREAVEKVQTMSEDEYMQRIADLREKAILDENSLKNEGIREGMEKGIQEGLEKGTKKGREEGERLGKLKLAKKMKEEGIPIETIIKITELTEEEILGN